MGQGEVWDAMKEIRGPASCRYIAEQAGLSFGATSHSLQVMCRWDEVRRIGKGNGYALPLYCLPGREHGKVHLTQDQRCGRMWDTYRRGMIHCVLAYGDMTTSRIAHNFDITREQVYEDMAYLVHRGLAVRIHADGWRVRQ